MTFTQEREDRLKREVVRPNEVEFSAQSLGDPVFRRDYGVRLAYAAGAMYKGIASPALVSRMANAHLLSFLGTGGLTLDEIRDGIRSIKASIDSKQIFGANLLCNLVKPEYEDQTVDVLLSEGVNLAEASAYSRITASLVRYRVLGLKENADGSMHIPHRMIAKLSRPEVAAQFLSPPAPKLVSQLVERGAISQDEARLSEHIAMADDITVEADSGGHTDRGILGAILPTIIRMRDEAQKDNPRWPRIRVGAAGGLGTPGAVAAAFLLGADYVLTGSINQCTVEAGTSDAVKDMLAQINVQDTQMAPAGDMFEIGAEVQVMSKGVFFPARAKKLYELYRQFNSVAEIDAKTRNQIEKRYFKRTFESVYEETKAYYERVAPEQIRRAEANPKSKMALIFRWYFVHSNRLALSGETSGKVDFQVHCGPALGAFNQWVRGTELEDWRNRHSDTIGEKLMTHAAELLKKRFAQWSGNQSLGI